MFFQTQIPGRIYVLKMVLPDETVIHKIGLTNTDRAVDRMLEILRSWFMSFRHVPYTELKLDMECGNPEILEKHIHKILAHKKFTPSKKVSGGTEMFTDIDEVAVIWYLRAYSNSSQNGTLDLTPDQYKNLGQWLSP